MSTLSAGTPDQCTPKRRGAVVSLPVLSEKPHASNPWQSGHNKIKHSRTGQWRAAVLVAVHLAIAIHIILWLRTGLTVSPVEPSEAMQTLREGVFNAGFVFFALALLSTAILGRVFCGWGCHIVALQDLCNWMMLKMGVKPKPFRSRLLILVPLGLAIYMFVWPVFHRLALRPMFMDARGRMPWWLGQSDPIPGVTTEFLVHDFWATFAPWPVAIPFILVCTFGAVYFLGSKGFCTYGCPYGGFFAPLDTVAVGKIRVTDACEGCGHCTAVCTSNVRVHEEVRDFGMVVDPGCMKCMDCVSVCPNEALYFGFGKPTVLAKPRTPTAREQRKAARAQRAARYELSRYEEVLVLAIFLVYFVSIRGMFNITPMLMAVGIGVILAFSTWKLWTMRPVRLGGTANVRLQSLQLRFRGRWKGAGWIFAVATIAGIAAASWGGFVRVHRIWGDGVYAQLTTPLNIALRPDYQATPREAGLARRGLAIFKRSAPRGEGGFGWSLSPDEELNLAYMHVVLGEFDEAEQRMNRVIETGHPRDSLIGQAVSLIRTRLPTDRKPTDEEVKAIDDRIVALHQRALDLHPELDGARGFLVGRKFQELGKGGGDALRAMWSGPAAERHPRVGAFLSMARLEMALGGADAHSRARAVVDRAARVMGHSSIDDRLAVASLLVELARATGPTDPAGSKIDLDRAIAMAHEASTIGPRAGLSAVSAAGLLGQAGRADEALQMAQTGLDRARKLGPHTGQIRTITSAADVLLRAGRKTEALELYKEAVALAARAGNGAWDIHGIGSQVLGVGASLPDGAFLLEGVKMLEAARDAAPADNRSAVILHDLARAYFFADRQIDAVRLMTDAARLADRNAFLARQLSELLASQNKPQESVEWEAIAQKREREAGKR